MLEKYDPQGVIIVQKEQTTAAVLTDLISSTCGIPTDQILFATSYETGKRLIMETPLARLIVLSIRLSDSDKDGRDLITFARNNPETKDTPIMVYSGYHPRESMEKECMRLGANFMWKKEQSELQN